VTAGVSTPTTVPGPTPDFTDPDVLAAVPLFPGELPGLLADLPFDPLPSGYHQGGANLTSAIDPADEADDVIGFGLLADFTTHYGDIAGLRVTTEGIVFETAAGASGYINDWIDDLHLGVGSTEPDVSKLVEFEAEQVPTDADEAIRAAYQIEYLGGDEKRAIAGGAAVIRSGRLVAWAWATGPDDTEVAAALDALQGPLTERLLLVV